MKADFDISKKHKITLANAMNYAVPIHHPTRKMVEHDFIYMVEGEWKIGQEDEIFSIKKGDVLILSANRSHFGVNLCAPGTKTLFIHVLYNEGDEENSPSDNRICLESYINTKESPIIKNCFEKIIYAYSCGDELTASSYFDVLLCELKNIQNNTAENSIAEKIRQMIVSSNSILKNTQIAKSLNVSVKTAENIFKNAFGTTIHRYVTETKIQQAKFQLVNFPEMKLYEISENLGFYDEFHLSRVFKKHTGLSPTEYKKLRT